MEISLMFYYRSLLVLLFIILFICYLFLQSAAECDRCSSVIHTALWHAAECDTCSREWHMQQRVTHVAEWYVQQTVIHAAECDTCIRVYDAVWHMHQGVTHSRAAGCRMQCDTCSSVGNTSACCRVWYMQFPSPGGSGERSCGLSASWLGRC